MKNKNTRNEKFEKLLFSIRMLPFHNYINDTQFENMIKKLKREIDEEE